MVFFNNVEQDFSQIDIDSIGSQETYNHYPVGAFCVRACVCLSVCLYFCLSVCVCLFVCV
jgi:hypothetical protein